MNHKATNLEEQIAECQQNWFPGHKAKVVTQNSEVTIIHWANPASWNYGCHFIIHKRWLIVVGDIGEAAYEWSSDLTLEFLGGLDFGYFKSKCRSSEVGRDFNDWNEYVAKKNLEDRIKEINDTPEDDRSDTDDQEFEALESLLVQGFDKHAFREAAQELYNDTGDSELAGSVDVMGVVPHPRCIGHFVGLQMAIKQLANPEQTIKA